MENPKLILSLRQRKLLYYMMNHKGLVTGKTLAAELGITDRTVRSDIAEINRNIVPYHASILAERSKGYWFQAEDEEKIHALNRIELGLMTKEERVRFLAFRLCLSEEPLHLYDLEEEMFTSHTTLEQDVKALQRQFVQDAPYIRLTQRNNELFFEQNEAKRRDILTRLVHDDWSYHKRGNAYYGYHFLEEENLNYIMDLVPICLYRHGIFLEDPALVYLDLMLTVAYQRFRGGHLLAEASAPVKEDPETAQACRELFAAMESHFACTFPETERKAVYNQIASTRLPDLANIGTEYVSEIVDPVCMQIVDQYLERIRGVFGIDLGGDEDFYATLCLTVSTFQNDAFIYNSQGNRAFAKERMMDEFEIAVLFQEIAREWLGRDLTEIELINLSHCIAGAVVYLFQTHPEYKIRTVICTHRNLMSLWHLKRVLLSQFQTYLDVAGLIPVNAHSGFDFSHTDLVLTTDDRKVTEEPGTETLSISYFMTPADSARIAAYIKRRQFEHLCPAPSKDLLSLMRRACWHEQESRKTKEEVIHLLAQDFVEEGLAGRLEQDILSREAVSSFVTGRSIVFLHSLLPAKKTRLSIMSLDHRIIWNSCKIRIIVLGVFAPQERTLLFHLKHLFCDRDREAMRMLKAKEEILEFFSSGESR